MAVFKCKMCGSDLFPEDGAGVVVCDLCGSEQTLPKAADDKKTALFNKANAFRMKKRFDEALKLYAEIQAKYPDEADAHWGKLLCEYGIEYVDDNKTERKIPTCNRTLSVSIFNHPEYKAAMKKATKEEGEIYKREAAEIDGYQKKILEIAKKEAPYDIFICFKELDSEGKRTKDSQLATKIYENLTKKNYKVFFSRVTLKSKVGSEYEPYIYAALQSAKVMLVLATKKEYVEAVWVRNEWSRYLGFMEADSGKSIVPCIKDIDAYDLPEALQDFQAQDMGELDFIENLTRAIDSKFGRGSYGESVPAPVVSASQEKNTHKKKEGKGDEMSPLLRRVFIHLQDGEWAQAHDVLERLFDQEPENAMGYVAALMVDLQVKTMDGLGELEKPFRENANYKKAIRYGDDELKEKLVGFNEPIEKNIIYAKAVALIKVGKIDSLQKAVPLLESIRGWKDSEELLASIPVRCEEIRKEIVYVEACQKLQTCLIEKVQEAQEEFLSIADWKDSQEKAELCKKRIQKLEEQERIEQEKERERVRREKQKKRVKAIAYLFVALAVITLIVLVSTVFVPISRFNAATEFFNGGNHATAIAVYDKFIEKDNLPGAKITVENGLKYWGRKKNPYLYLLAVDDKNITVANIQDGCRIIADDVFKNCDSLTSVEIPDSVTVIGDDAFYSCDRLTSVEIGDRVTTIGDHAFEYCRSLTSVDIGDGVTTIGDWAFGSCNGLTSVIIGDSVTTIGDWAFGSCDSLTSVIIGDSVTVIGDDAFDGCYKLVEVVNKSTHIIVTKGSNSNGYAGYYALAVYNSGTAFTGTKLFNDNGYIIYTDGNEKILLGYNGTETDLVLPSYVTKINKNAFRNCDGLMSVVIGDSVTSIGDLAFYDCDSLTSVTIPDNVKTIGECALHGCNSLTDIYYKGTEAAWQKITIGDYNTDLMKAKIHYNS